MKRALVGVLIAPFCLLATLAVADDPALEAAVDKIGDGLSQGDATIRARAMKEAAALSPDAVPVILSRLPKEVGSRRFDGLLDAAAAIDVERAVAEVEGSRSGWKARGWLAPADASRASKEKAASDAPRVVDAILARLRSRRPESASRSARLTSSQLSESFVVPPWIAVEVVGKTLPESVAGAAYGVRERDGQLEIDVTRSARYAVRVAPDMPQVVELGSRKTLRKVLVWRRLGHWYVAPAATFTVGMDSLFAEFLDTDQDGEVTGADDLVRFGGGAFRRVRESDLAWSSTGLVRFEVRKEGTGSSAACVIHFTKEPQPAWMNETQAKMLGRLNAWRQQIGLPPQWGDRDRSDACHAHFDYWVQNGFSAHDQEKGAPKASAAGALAGKSSSVTNGPDGPDFVTAIEWTVLHRNSCVAHPDEGAGLWAGDAGSLLWGGRDDMRERGFPLLIPGPGMDGVPILCEPEVPVPDRDPKWYEEHRGAPVSVTWSRLGGVYDDIKNLKLELFVDGEGEPLKGTLWCKEHRYREDFAAGFPENSIFFCADGALAKDTRYVARFRADAPTGPVEFSWEFRTVE